MTIEAFDGPTESITPELINSIFEPVGKNKLRVLEAAFEIEGALERIIAHYFFGEDECNKASSNNFSKLVLASDWCSFSSKRRLVMHIVNEKNALTGEAKNTFDKLLGKVMTARNAFAHGAISTDGRRVKLAYFQGAPKSEFLDDDYLAELEITLNKCWRLVHEVAFSTGALRQLPLKAA